MFVLGKMFIMIPRRDNSMKNLKYHLLLALILCSLVSCNSGTVATPENTPTNSPDITITDQMPTSTIEVSSTESASDSLEGNSELKIVFSEFRLGDQGDRVIYIANPFDKLANSQVINNQKGLIAYNSPSLSPDGEKIIFAFDDYTGSRINTIRKNGTDLRPLLFTNNLLPMQRFPSWSPDGLYITFTVEDKLYRADPYGYNLEFLAELSGLSYPAWSRDGEKIAFLAEWNDEGAGKIFIIDKDGNNLHTLTDAIAGDSQISWSPDGQQIAFMSLGGCGDISTIRLASGKIENITNTPNMEKDPAWSPDGNYIAFASATYTNCLEKVRSSYPQSLIFLADLTNHTILDLMSQEGSKISLFEYESFYEPSWWPLVVVQKRWSYKITEAGDRLNVRENPSMSANKIGYLYKGDIFTAVEGPVEAEDYHWWKIRSNTGFEGWCVDVPGWYVFESTNTNP
jgi:Tol biopolymer transport system component